MGTKEDIPFGTWLRREMRERGYDIEGPRAGGKTRLANETGISLSIISRILSDNRVPEIKALRALGAALGYTLGEMMIHAGVAAPEEIASRVHVGPVRAGARVPAPQVQVPAEVGLEDLAEWEQYIWRAPVTVAERELAILMIRLSRGDIDTDALLDLSHAINEALAKKVGERRGPSRAG
ncbi:helix-turn-helix domain-containing protein [Spirillospora sp. NBC_01491]|uniref:helix-turn-helix domain-containing protein n=1 Tax=Spirillospora sp. NBC_01491 TaxID=2976007 RepID=UPI002E330F2F|nr:helix-turn-helix transcriptional regulator [Spirillospora sp. NBC_01491]